MRTSRALSVFVFCLLFVFPRPAISSTHVVLEHALKLGATDDFWHAWTALTTTERENRGEAVSRWLNQLRTFGDTVLLDGPDLPVGSYSWLIPDPDRLDQARTIALDYLVGLAYHADLRVGLELRPSTGELTTPENLVDFVKLAKHLAERYDGDTDFGIDTPGLPDQMPFPDINESFGVNTSDWQNSSEADLQAFADTHKIAFYTVGAGLSLKDDEKVAEHGAWIAAISAALAEADPDLELWVGPLRLSEMKKSDLVELTTPIFAKERSAFAGFLVDLDLQVTDMGAEDVRSALKILSNTVAALEGDGVGLVVSGMQVPSAPGANDAAWVRPCDVTISCTPEIQSDLLVKSSVRARGLGLGVGLAEVIVTQHNDTALGPLAKLPSNRWETDVPEINLAGSTWRRWRTFRQRLGNTTAEMAAPAQNVSVYLLGEADITGGRVLWYDWYREVPRGSSYTGTEKTVEMATPEGAKRAMIYELRTDDQDLGDFENEIDLQPVETLPVSEGGNVSLVLRDRVVLVEFSDEEVVVAPDVSSSDVAVASDATESTDVGPTLVPPSSSGGCQSTTSSPASPFLLLLLSLAVLGRQRLRLPV